MLSADAIALFFAAAVALALMPGPDNLFVLLQAVLYGRLAGWCVTLGLCTGLLLHTAAVAFGVAAVFQTSAWAFDALKIIGAGYLGYLAWRAFTAQPDALTTQQKPRLSRWGLYLRGIVMNVTNPKVALFFLAFLPQFVVPESGSVAGQIVLLGGVFMVATLLVFGAVASSAGVLAHRLQRSQRAQRLLNLTAGVVLAGLALRLVFSQA